MSVSEGRSVSVSERGSVEHGTTVNGSTEDSYSVASVSSAVSTESSESVTGFSGGHSEDGPKKEREENSSLK